MFGGRRRVTSGRIVGWGAVWLVLELLSVGRADALDPRSPLTDYSVTNWPEDAGPFPFGVYSIAQDADGYLWLGARTGLIRFDGTVFKRWSGSRPLPDDRISAIYVARDGSLWLGFGTIGGVSRIRHGEVTNFSASDGLTAGNVNMLGEDDDGVIWAATYGGLSRFAGSHWEHVDAREGLPSEPILSFLMDRQKNFWAGTGAGVYRRGSASEQFELVSPATAVGFAEDAAGSIWISDREKGFALLQGRDRGARPSLGYQDVLGRSMLYDRSGSLWVGTRGGGLIRIQQGLPAVPKATVSRLTRHDGLPSNEIRCLFEDRQGSLWIGTRMGLSRLKDSNVRAILSDDDSFVTAVTTDRDGHLWIGTSEGARRRRGDREDIYGVEQGLPSLSVTAIYADPAGTVWVATTGGIARFNGRRFVPVDASSGIRLANVQSMTADPNGTIWICDQTKGVVRLQADGQLAQIDQPFTRDGPPYVAYTDRDKRVWLGLWSTGVARYTGTQYELFSVADGLPPGTVNVLHQDRHGAIWIGTSKGLARFADGKFTTFTRNGFPLSAVVSIIEDDQGFLWFGLPAGLLRASLDEFEATSADPNARLRYNLYGTEEGVPGTLGRPGMPSSARGADGRLWFVTSVGLAVVDPHHLHPTEAPGAVHIEGIVADGVDLRPGPPLQLSPRTARIQIDYSIVSLSVGRLRFRYRLEDFDPDWQDAGDRRQASYTSLPPGSYRFRVMSGNSEGGWNEPGDTLTFSIQPAIYQTSAFALGVLASVALVMWSAWRLRLRSIQRRFDLVLGERSRMGREIHDTLLQSLVGVALEFDDIWEQLDPSAAALRSQVQRIREQVEHYIREARHSIWNLRSPTLETRDLSTALREAGEAAVGSGPARVEFEVYGAVRPAEARVEEQLLRVGQEALTNAIRHSAAHVIRVELSYERDVVRLRVSDDGRGFDPAAHGVDGERHWGVTSMRERAQQVGARFVLVTAPGSGTTVEMIATLRGSKEGKG